jgi:hypothetical protein
MRVDVEQEASGDMRAPVVAEVRYSGPVRAAGATGPEDCFITVATLTGTTTLRCSPSGITSVPVRTPPLAALSLPVHVILPVLVMLLNFAHGVAAMMLVSPLRGGAHNPEIVWPGLRWRRLTERGCSVCSTVCGQALR